MTRLQIILRDKVGCLPGESQRELSKPNEQINQATQQWNSRRCARGRKYISPPEQNSFYRYYMPSLAATYFAVSGWQPEKFAPVSESATNCSWLRLYWLLNAQSQRANERARKLPLGWQHGKLLGFCSKRRRGHTRRMPTRTRGLYLNWQQQFGNSRAENQLLAMRLPEESVTRRRSSSPKCVTSDHFWSNFADDLDNIVLI